MLTISNITYFKFYKYCMSKYFINAKNINNIRYFRKILLKFLSILSFQKCITI